jgi:hypothetical protein
MKGFVPAVVALVAGIVIGAWQPRGELLAARAELDSLRTGSKPCKGAAADGIRSILHADAPVAPVAPGSSKKKTTVHVGADAPPAEPSTPPEATPSSEPAASDTPDPETPEQLRDAMHTGLDARRAQARAALQEQGDLSDDQMRAVDAIMDDMNGELKKEVDLFVKDAVAKGDVDRRDMMDFAAGALDVVIAADDKMRAQLPAELWDSVDDSALDPFSYVSGTTLDSVTDLKDVTTSGLDR